MNAPEPIPFKTESPQPLLRETPQDAAYPVLALGPLSPRTSGGMAGAVSIAATRYRSTGVPMLGSAGNGAARLRQGCEHEGTTPINAQLWR